MDAITTIIITDVKYDDSLAMWKIWEKTLQAHSISKWIVILTAIKDTQKASTFVSELWDLFLSKYHQNNSSHILTILEGFTESKEKRHEKDLFGNLNPDFTLKFFSEEDIPPFIHRLFVMSPHYRFPFMKNLVQHLVSYDDKTPAFKATGVGYNTSIFDDPNGDVNYLLELHDFMPQEAYDILFNNYYTWKPIRNLTPGSIPVDHPLNETLPEHILEAAQQDSRLFRKAQVKKALGVLERRSPNVHHQVNTHLLNLIENVSEGDDIVELIEILNAELKRLQGVLDNVDKKNLRYLDKVRQQYKCPTVEVTDVIQMTLVFRDWSEMSPIDLVVDAKTNHIVFVENVNGPYHAFLWVDMNEHVDIITQGMEYL